MTRNAWMVHRPWGRNGFVLIDELGGEIAGSEGPFSLGALDEFAVLGWVPWHRDPPSDDYPHYGRIWLRREVTP